MTRQRITPRIHPSGPTSSHKARSRTGHHSHPHKPDNNNVRTRNTVITATLHANPWRHTRNPDITVMSL
jgi:hypothetical protein